VRAAVEESDTVRVALVEDAYFARLFSGKASAAELIFFLKNRAPERWRDKVDVGVTFTPEDVQAMTAAMSRVVIAALARALAGGGAESAHRDGAAAAREALAVAHTCYRQTRRGQVDRDTSRRDGEAGVDECGADPLATLLHRAGRKADDGPLRESLGRIDFDGDVVSVDAEHGGGADGGEHGHQHSSGSPPETIDSPRPTSRRLAGADETRLPFEAR
jgi:hypothetical protein